MSELIKRLKRLRAAETTGRPAFVDTVDAAAVATVLPAELAFLGPAQEPDELGRLGGFRILQVLGAGGMGLVLRAEDTTIRRAVAMKVMKPGIAALAGAATASCAKPVWCPAWTTRTSRPSITSARSAASLSSPCRC